MFANRRALRHLATGLLICGAQACGQSKVETLGTGEVPAGSEGFEQTSFPLITAGCTVNAGTQTVTFTMATMESLYMFKRAADGVVVANAFLAPTPAVECTFPTTYRVVVNGASGSTHKVLFDFIGGAFGLATAATGGAGTNPGPNLVVNFTGGGSANTVKIRGTSNWDAFTFGSITAAGTTTSYGSLNIGTATALAAARTFPDLSMVNVQNVVVAAGPGNDMITAQGGAPTGTGSLAMDGAIGFDVYGGDGNDTIISGAASTGGASNNLFGNKGDDMFIQQVAKARDNISGSDSGTADSDTLDYSLRTNPLSVTLGDDLLAQITSSGRVNCVTKANTADNDTFRITDGTTTKTFEYQKSVVAASTGQITTDIQANYADNETLVLNDGVHPAITFEYAVSGAPGGLVLTNPADTWIDISGASSANDVAVATYTAIAAAAGASFTIAATSPGATAIIALSNPTGHNNAVTSSGTGSTLVGMTGGTSFALTTPGDFAIDISGATTAAEVCTATAAAITTNVGLLTVTATQAQASDTFVTIAISPVAFKPSGAAITKVTGGAMLSVVDFSAGTAFGSNDGEMSELDSINNDIENIIGGAGADTLDATYSTLTTHILVGMTGADTLIGSNLADTLWGGVGDDILKGGGGVDILNGGDGNDTLQGGLASDTIDGGGFNCAVVPATQPVSPNAAVPATTSCTAGALAKGAANVNPGINTLDYSDRGSSVIVIADITNLGSTATQTGAMGEKDIVALVGATGTPYSVQYLRGGAGNDTLSGDGLANIIWGGGGNDIINGNGGNDALYGEAGNDTIHGDAASLPAGQTAGDDFINTGTGTNTIFGDAGNDFVDDLAATGAGTVDCGLGDSDVLMTTMSSGMNCEL